ncbi:hypothetical protein RRF57_001724 [Xylaria bambusicola]|uniref:Uncharacterized protein n=1 Tax=Xylaria bambusicola TaxID=326684 RepID=A0AAN7UCE8_9PEZI
MAQTNRAGTRRYPAHHAPRQRDIKRIRHDTTTKIRNPSPHLLSPDQLINFRALIATSFLIHSTLTLLIHTLALFASNRDLLLSHIRHNKISNPKHPAKTPHASENSQNRWPSTVTRGSNSGPQTARPSIRCTSRIVEASRRRYMPLKVRPKTVDPERRITPSGHTTTTATSTSFTTTTTTTTRTSSSRPGMDGRVQLLRSMEGLEKTEEAEIPPGEVESGAQAHEDGVRCRGVGISMGRRRSGADGREVGEEEKEDVEGEGV